MIEQIIQTASDLMHLPKADFDKNMRAFIAEGMERLDLVSRETFLRQEQQLQVARQAIRALEARICELEQALAPHTTSTTDE